MTERLAGLWRRATRDAKTQGFTIIEVVVAALLLALVLLPLLGLFIGSVSVASKSETENTASLLAQEQIEEIRGLNYDAMALDSNKIDAQSGITGTPPVYTYAGLEYDVVAVAGGAVAPISTDLKRRNSYYDVRRYLLWVDDPAGGVTDRDYKKIVIVVSWDKPTPGSMTFEADAQKIGSNNDQPPVVVGTFPYIGDAFYDWSEIGTATATATDPDGTPLRVRFEYKKNVNATFSHVGTDTSGTLGPDGYDFSTSWGSTLTDEAQYNMRVIATDNDDLTGTETHPFFIDRTPPLPPSAAAVANAVGFPADATGALPWPLRLTWNPANDFIDGNTNFNMVIGYLIYRDERGYQLPPDPAADPPPPTVEYDWVVSDVPLATIYGSEVSEFYDATPVTEFTDSLTGEPLGTEVRYRIKSLGRASYWRTSGLGVLSQITTGCRVVPPMTSLDPFLPSSVIAEPASWSAVNVSLYWSTSSPANTLYLVYRTPGWQSASESLVGTLYDPDGGLDELVYKDDNLARNTTYTYRVVPVSPYGYPSSMTGVSAAPVTTSLY